MKARSSKRKVSSISGPQDAVQPEGRTLSLSQIRLVTSASTTRGPVCGLRERQVGLRGVLLQAHEVPARRAACDESAVKGGWAG